MANRLFHWFIGALIAIFALPALGIPVKASSDETHNIAAETGQAALILQSTATAPPALLLVTPSATPTSPPTVTVTPTYSVPMLTLRKATNCRTGPGVVYDIIVTYQINQTLEIVGRYDYGNFWLVKSAQSPTGSCWLWGEFADVAGSFWTVASVTPPPMPTVAPPRAPSLQDYKYDCDGFNNTMSLYIIWNDRANNEAGYRIFRDGLLVADLPAGSTTFTETIIMPLSADYSVQVYNAAGAADLVIRRMMCA